MKHILIVTVPDTIPDPEFRIEARVKGTIDERIPVEFREVVLPTPVEILLTSSDSEHYVNDQQRIGFQKGVKWFKSVLQ